MTEPKVLTLVPLVPKKSRDVKPEPAQTISKPTTLKRSDSFTGLSSLKHGVEDLESLVKDQRKALDDCRQQITIQNELILSYQKILEEHDQLFSSIIDG